MIFDAGDRRQLSFARERPSEVSDQPTTFLLTGLSRKDGWAELGRVTAQLERRVYLLTPALRERIAVERVPAVIEAEGLRFRVAETAMRGTLEHADAGEPVPTADEPAEDSE